MLLFFVKQSILDVGQGCEYTFDSWSEQVLSSENEPIKSQSYHHIENSLLNGVSWGASSPSLDLFNRAAYEIIKKRSYELYWLVASDYYVYVNGIYYWIDYWWRLIMETTPHGDNSAYPALWNDLMMLTIASFAQSACLVKHNYLSLLNWCNVCKNALSLTNSEKCHPIQLVVSTKHCSIID